MNSSLIELLVLAGIAIFLVLRLRNVLGTREGFEKPQAPSSGMSRDDTRRDFEVIEGGPDHDIVDHVEEGSPSARALASMKRVEPSFSVAEFLGGARAAYEMILMGFERGSVDDLLPFLSPDVFEMFSDVIAQRNEQGLTIEAEFIGVRETVLKAASFDETTGEAEITIRFVAEMTSVVKDANGEIIEGSPNTVKRQKDVWTFARKMGTDDPNWKLVATDE